MRKYLSVVLIALALTACGGTEQENEPSRQSVEQNFVEVIRDNVDEGQASDQDIIDLGYTLCDGLDSGVSIEEQVLLGMDVGFPPEEAGFIVGASVGAFCPEHEDLFNE